MGNDVIFRSAEIDSPARNDIPVRSFRVNHHWKSFLLISSEF